MELPNQNRTSWSEGFNPEGVELPPLPPELRPLSSDEKKARIEVLVLRRELHLAKARILELELEKLGVKP